MGKNRHKKKGNPRWRADGVTDRQKNAIKNISEGWNIPTKVVDTKGEADAEIKRMMTIISDFKNNPNERDIKAGERRVDDPIPVFREKVEASPGWGEWS